MKEEKPIFDHPQTQGMIPSGFGNTTPTDDLLQKINDLSARLDSVISSHQHNGNSATRINFNTDIIGLFETVSVAPTIRPNSPYEQVKVYVNGATLRLYWYDTIAGVWHYVTATA